MGAVFSILVLLILDRKIITTDICKYMKGRNNMEIVKSSNVMESFGLISAEKGFFTEIDELELVDFPKLPF